MNPPPRGPFPGYGLGYPSPPRPPRSSNTLVIVIVVIAVTLALGGGACILLVSLAAVADSSAPDADAGSAPASSGPAAVSVATSAPSSNTAQGSTAPLGGADTSSIDGRYECFQMRVVAGPNFSFTTQWIPGALPGFSISGGSYQAKGGAGSVSVANSIVTFVGGAYGSWRGTTGSNTTGFFIRFRGKDPSNPRAGESTKSGDYQCYRQK